MEVWTLMFPAREILLLLVLFGAQASYGQERLPAPGTERRSGHDWLLACVSSYSIESTPIVLGKITPDNAREIARRTAEGCDARLADPDIRARVLKHPPGQQLLESAGQYPASVHLEWLTGCILDFASLRPGTKRHQLDQYLRQEGGIFWPEHQSFYHHECRYLQVGLDFQSVGVNARFGLSPEDVVVAVEDVELDLMRTD